MVVVDRFLIMAQFRALTKTATAKDATQVFLKEVWKLNELPELIISDGDKQWASAFWNGLCGLLGIKKKMSTSFHP
jgi:hypothetical protein